MAHTSWTRYGNGNGRDEMRMRRDDSPQSVRPIQGDRQSFRQLQGEMNRLFENFFGNSNVQSQPWSGTAMPTTDTNVNVGSPTPTTVSRSQVSPQPMQSRQFQPCIEVTEDAETVHVMAELPGIDSSDIELYCNENSLTITGEKRHQTIDDDGSFLESERAYGAFRRAIPFNVAVDTENAEATFENGVLHVQLPKAGSSKGTKLNIQ